MPGLIPVMLGSQGLAEKEFFVLGEQAVVTLGRSRTCDVSFQRFRKYLAMPEAERLKQDDRNAMVSRLHMRVTVTGTRIVAENLSNAGSWANDVRFTGTVEHDLATGDLKLRLGPAKEVFTVTRLTEPEVEELLIPTMPPPPKQKPELPRADEPTPVGVTMAVAGNGGAKQVSGRITGDMPTAPGITFPVANGQKTLPIVAGEELLAFLENAGATCADRGCGMGSCQTCKLRAVKGRANVTMITPYDDSGMGKDEFLPCCSSAIGPVDVVKA